MCGIAAVFSPNEPVSLHCLRSATQVLNHRGPDSRNHWIADHQRVGLGHTRLSIIDLTTGDQPLATADDSLHLVVNGEFYDFERIRAELSDHGHRFSTKSDSEIALHLYERYGTAGLKHLRGEFAFVLWDEKNQTLFAARDRFGIKPLFYAKIGEKLYIASEIKALLAMGVPAEWDEESQYQLHSALLLRQGRTLFRGIQQVPPGHYLLASANQFQVIPYWDFHYPEAHAVSKISTEDAVALIREKLDTAIKLRLRADVPVGAYLSGGLDSCSVLGFAARALRRPIRAFTLSFDEADYDEKAIAAEMAAHAGAEFVPISIQSSDLAHALEDTLWHSEMILSNTHSVAKFLLSRAVRNAGYKVVLTGEGSDEIFAGYPPSRRDMLLYNSQGQDPQALQNQLSELNRANAVSQGLLSAGDQTMQIPTLQKILGFAPSFLEVFSLLGKALVPTLTPEFARAFAGHDPYRALLNELDVSRQLLGRDPVNQALYLWSKTNLPNYILNVLGDRMEMANSVEGRLPFLDHELVEAVVQLPVSLKINGMIEKFVLREAARPVITDTVYRRQKHPFLAPPATLRLGEPLYQLLQDTLRSPLLESVPFYQPSKIRGLLDQLPHMTAAQRVAVDPGLMVILSNCLLHKRFMKASMAA